jgi:hypothetical protein
MKIKVYVIDVRLPRWLRRALLFGAVPLALLGLSALVYASAVTGQPDFNDGDILTAAALNAHLGALQNQINSGGTVTSVAAGSGLAGGPINTTGTLSLASAYQDGSAYDSRFVNTAGDTMTGALSVPALSAGSISERDARYEVYTGMSAFDGFFHDSWSNTFNMAYTLIGHADSTSWIPLRVRSGETIISVSNSTNIRPGTISGFLTMDVFELPTNTDSGGVVVATTTVDLATMPTSIGVDCHGYVIKANKQYAIRLSIANIGGTAHWGLYSSMVATTR